VHNPSVLILRPRKKVRTKKSGWRLLTTKLPLHLKEPLSLRILGVICLWETEMLFPDRKHVVPLHIHHRFPTAHAEGLALDLHDVAAIKRLDAEAVAREGQNALC